MSEVTEECAEEGSWRWRKEIKRPERGSVSGVSRGATARVHRSGYTTFAESGPSTDVCYSGLAAANRASGTEQMKNKKALYNALEHRTNKNS